MTIQLRSTFENWLSSLKTKDGLDPLPVVWGRRPQKLYSGPIVLAYDGPRTHLGWDFPQWEYDDLTGELKEKRVALLRYVLRLSFRAYDQDPDFNARYFAERFKLLAYGTTSIDTLNASDIGLWGIGEIFDTDYEWSGRWVSQADTSVILGVRAELQDPTYGGGFIQIVNIEQQGIVTDEYGNPIHDEQGNPVVIEDSSQFTVTTQEAP